MSIHSVDVFSCWMWQGNKKRFLNRCYPWQVNLQGRSPTVTGGLTSFQTQPLTRCTSPVWSWWLWQCRGRTWATLCSMSCSRGQSSCLWELCQEMHRRNHSYVTVMWALSVEWWMCVLQSAAGSSGEHHSVDERYRTGHHGPACTHTIFIHLFTLSLVQQWGLVLDDAHSKARVTFSIWDSNCQVCSSVILVSLKYCFSFYSFKLVWIFGFSIFILNLAVLGNTLF